MNRSVFILFYALAGCATVVPDVVPNVDDAITPGIFLEPGVRDTLPAGVMLRPVYEKGLALTKESEGFRPHLYNDVARYCTIGYGHLIKLAPCNGAEPEDFKDGVTEPEGASLLTIDMESAQRTVMVTVDVDLTDAQFAALCDFVYNVGPTRFKESTLLRVINARQFDRVPTQLRRWIIAGGRQITGLVNRREREIKLFFDGAPVPRATPSAGEDVSLLDIRTGR
jgi:lysozyme